MIKPKQLKPERMLRVMQHQGPQFLGRAILGSVNFYVQLAVLRVLGERSIQHGRTVNICFVDYEKAFDRVTGIY